MFGRRRPVVEATSPVVAASVAVEPRGVERTPAPPAPTGLTDAQVLALVRDRLAATFGDDGSWTVRRRTEDDSDELFQSVFLDSLSRDVTEAICGTGPRVDVPVEAHLSEALSVVALADGNAARPGELDAGDGRRTMTVTIVPDEPAESVAHPAAGDVPAPVVAASADDVSGDAAEPLHMPTHRHDESEGDDDAVLDEESLALQWAPAPITVWTDLKRPVTGEIALELLHSAGR